MPSMHVPTSWTSGRAQKLIGGAIGLVEVAGNIDSYTCLGNGRRAMLPCSGHLAPSTTSYAYLLPGRYKFSCVLDLTPIPMQFLCRAHTAPHTTSGRAQYAAARAQGRSNLCWRRGAEYV